MKSLFSRKAFSRNTSKVSKVSDDTISINSEWLLDEDEKEGPNDVVVITKETKKSKKGKKEKKESATPLSNWKNVSSKGRGIPGSKTMLSILKNTTWDLCEKFQQKEQTSYFAKVRKQALKLVDADDLDGLLALIASENSKEDEEKEENEMDGGMEKTPLTLFHEQLSDPKNHMNLLHTALEENMKKVATHLVSTANWQYLTTGYTNIEAQIPPSSRNILHIVTEQGDLDMFQIIYAKLQSLNPSLPATFQAVLGPSFEDTPVDKVKRFLNSKTVMKSGNGKRRVGLAHLAAMNGYADFFRVIGGLGVSLDAPDSWKETPLMWAAQKGKLEAFNELLRLGVDVNAQNQYGCTALHLVVTNRRLEMAVILIHKEETELNKERIKNPKSIVSMVAKHNDVELMKILVRSGVRERIDRNVLTKSLFIAANLGHSEVIEVILEQIPGLTNSTDDLGNTPVMVAAKNLKLPAVKVLIGKYKADIAVKNHLLETIFDLAMRQEENDLLVYLMEQTKSDEMLKPVYLHTAAANDDNEKIDFILKTGKMSPLQLDANDNTIFHTSAAHNSYKVLEYFLAKDDDLTELQNREGETPLHVAIKNGNLQSVRTLLDRNASSNVCDASNQNALHCSLSSPHCCYEIVAMVLEKMKQRCPDDLNDQDFDGNTALHLAAKFARGDLFELLVDLDPNVENMQGETALHMAVRMGGQREVDAVLERFYTGDRLDVVNVDRRDIKGCTALYKSAEMADVNKFESIMRKGADITATDSEGRSILHRLIEKSVQNAADEEKYVVIYESIVKWSVKWLCKREGSRLPLENTSHYYEVRLQAVRHLTSRIYFQSCNVLQYASTKGAASLLACILRTPNVYKFDDTCPIKITKTFRKSISSPPPSNLILSNYIVSKNKDDNKALYDITFLIPSTRAAFEEPSGLEVNSKGLTSIISDSKASRLSCLEHIVDTKNEEFINDILDREPFNFMVSKYWKLCRRTYELLMWMHVIFMIIFTYFTLPSREFLKHRFNDLNHQSDENLLAKRFEYVKSLGWLLIWPVFILISKAVMATFYLMNVKEWTLCWREVTLGDFKVSEITSGLMRLPVGLMLFFFNNLSSISALIFSFSSIAWFMMVLFSNSVHDYLQCLAIVMIFGWMHTIAYVKGFKDWNALVSILKQVIIKDITCFIYIYIFVLISFGYAMHVLLQADYHLDQDHRYSTTTIYLTFMRMLSPGNLMDISESKDFEAAGGRAYFIRALCAIYAIFGTVILMNMLIAMMNSTYSAIRENKSTAWRIDSLSFALWLERNFPCACWSVVLKLSTTYDREQNRWYILKESLEGPVVEEKEDEKELSKSDSALAIEAFKESKKSFEAMEKMTERMARLEEEVIECRNEMLSQLSDDKSGRMMMTDLKMEMKRIQELLTLLVSQETLEE